MKAAERESWTKWAGDQNAIRSQPVDAPAPKYGNVKVQVDGTWFDSKKEAARFQELKYMQHASLIADLELQPVFPLHVMELFRSQSPIVVTTIGVFSADFRYTDLKSGEIVVEDVKSEATKHTAYRLRKKIAEAVHGIYVREL